MTSADVTERADFLRCHHLCKPQIGITEELIFERAVYQAVLNRTLTRIYLIDHKSRILISSVQMLM